MAGKNVAEVVIAPGGTVRVAPVGTAIPVDEEAVPNVAFIDIGHVSEDGATLRSSADVEGIGAWATPYDILKVLAGRNGQVAFVARQWNRDTMKLAFGGGTVSQVSAGHYKFAPPDDNDPVAEYAFLIDWTYGTKVYRLVVLRGSLADEVETQLVRNAAADLPLTFDVNGEAGVDNWYLLTNDPAFNPA